MAHYYINVDFTPMNVLKEEPGQESAVISLLQKLNGKYEVVEMTLIDEVTPISFASIRKGVTAPVSGSTYLNPHEVYNNDTGRRIAFKRAVQQIVDAVADARVEFLGKNGIARFNRIAMAEFRRLRFTNEAKEDK